MKRQMELSHQRYDLKNDPAPGVMSRKKPVQQGVRAKLSQGDFQRSTGPNEAQEIRERDVFPALF